MSDGVIWFRCFPGDYLRDTKRLTLEQHGAYWLLMLDYYINGPLPDDDEVLARIAGITVERWGELAPVLRRYFHSVGGHLRHKRIDAERAEAHERIEKASARGKAGARGRWGKSSSDASSNASSMHQEMLEHCQPQPQAHPEPQPISLFPSPGKTPGEGKRTARRRAHPACPIDDLVAMYHETLPDNPRVQGMPPRRRIVLAAAKSRATTNGVECPSGSAS